MPSVLSGTVTLGKLQSLQQTSSTDSSNKVPKTPVGGTGPPREGGAEVPAPFRGVLQSSGFQPSNAATP